VIENVPLAVCPIGKDFADELFNNTATIVRHVLAEEELQRSIDLPLLDFDRRSPLAGSFNDSCR